MQSVKNPREDEGVPADPDAAAAYWVARQQLRLLHAHEEANFRAWLGHAEHAEAYRRAQWAMQATASLAAHPDVAAMREAALAMAPRPKPHAHWGRWLAAAASLAALIVAVGVFAPDRIGLPQGLELTSGDVGGDSNTVPAALDSLAPTPSVYSTVKGQQRVLTLNDGSMVTLDTASTVQVAYAVDRRNVMLLQGQAFFRVAKDKQRPFVVTAGDRRVTAVGTAFDVRMDGGRVRVALVEGRVHVDPLHPQGLARLIPSVATQTLDAGQELIVAVDGNISIAMTDVERTTRWQQDQLIFRDDTVEAAAAELNRYAIRPIVIGDPRIAALRISGVFGTGRVDNFVAALTAYYPIAVHRESSGAITLTWRPAREAD